MDKIYNFIKKTLKKYWIGGLLVLCVLAAFLPPVLNISVAVIALVILVSRMFVINARKVS